MSGCLVFSALFVLTLLVTAAVGVSRICWSSAVGIHSGVERTLRQRNAATAEVSVAANHGHLDARRHRQYAPRSVCTTPAHWSPALPLPPDWLDRSTA